MNQGRIQDFFQVRHKNLVQCHSEKIRKLMKKTFSRYRAIRIIYFTKAHIVGRLIKYTIFLIIAKGAANVVQIKGWWKVIELQ